MEAGIGWPEAALWGAVGGAVVELLYLRQLHRQARRKQLPAFVRSQTYVLLALLSVAVSALLPVIYVRSDFSLKALVAFSVGASMPAFVQAAGSLWDPDKGNVS
jgi:hypothetical protein